ncbi:ribose 5-phosphate isomerase B [Pseudobacteroides cellulosolvens]|uniref:Ribose 5-phosphate isomerase B n=1 Tax=Pseudobacteroides cellulosolvens ATCC 35603 = DSM 2933 TaxID=398512 RepID=A0A0L6JSW9_9FIRM|nr:ribose 5-phosphate isomerase B [Pseudobacteroides cellulosolvens]KNY28522.1 ribose 5-phosphate isomerase B [Pseudobacteroides cellulosolvens ATCC 35603 = DSM 2933]
MIGIGSDHGGFNLKTEIIKFLKEKGYEVKDFGTYSTESVDYPDFGQAVTEAVSEGECDKGIVICGTGIGISIAANKVKGIRAALCTDTYMARMSREHNNANILALGERVVGIGAALDIVETWLDTEFAGGRHQLRLDKIAQIEEKYRNK